MEFGGKTSATAPPRAPVQFLEATSETKKATRDAATNGLTLDGSWCFTLKLRGGKKGAAAITNARSLYLAEVETRRYKIGLKIKDGQSVDSFSFRKSSGAFQMDQIDDVTTELTDNFPTNPEDKWVGFMPPAGAQRQPKWHDGLTVCYRYTLSLSPIAAPPQAVVCLVTFGDMPFTQHHLKMVLLFSDREKKVVTKTRALVP
jgi:hypothetical protein